MTTAKSVTIALILSSKDVLLESRMTLKISRKVFEDSQDIYKHMFYRMHM